MALGQLECFTLRIALCTPDCTQLLQTSQGLQVLQTLQRLQKFECIAGWSAKWSFALQFSLQSLAFEIEGSSILLTILFKIVLKAH